MEESLPTEQQRMVRRHDCSEISDVGIFQDICGAHSVLAWDAARASFWKKTFLDRCSMKACHDLHASLQVGKYVFLLSIIPTFQSPRPSTISLGNLAGRSLYKWLLSSHCRELETGRYDKIPRPDRFCKWCWKLVFLRVVGDEQHALTACARGELVRRQILADLSTVPGLESIVTMFDAVPELPKLTQPRQNLFWKYLTRLILAVTNALVQERS